MTTYDLSTTTPTKLVAGDIINIPYTKTEKSITLPKGEYKFECWGGYGHYSTASDSSGHTYGYGGYATGILDLKTKTTFYIYVGGRSTTTYSSSYYDGGWNGGGGKASGSSYNDNGTGGGATDICLVRSDVTRDSHGTYKRTDASYKSRIIVAGGGGGGRSNNILSQGGYSPCTSTSAGVNGSMTAAGSVANGNAGGFGYGCSATNSSDDSPGGGGGWYGGGNVSDSYGGGGSSFVWSDTYASYVPSGYTPSADYKMTNVSCQLGSANASPAGATSNGYARITVIDVVPPIEAYIKINNGWKKL